MIAQKLFDFWHATKKMFRDQDENLLKRGCIRREIMQDFVYDQTFSYLIKWFHDCIR